MPALVDGWLEKVAHLPAGRRADHARLGLAVVRGLLLDLVATGDRAGTDRALAAFTALLRAVEEASVAERVIMGSRRRAASLP